MICQMLGVVQLGNHGEARGRSETLLAHGADRKNPAACAKGLGWTPVLRQQ